MTRQKQIIILAFVAGFAIWLVGKDFLDGQGQARIDEALRTFPLNVPRETINIKLETKRNAGRAGCLHGMVGVEQMEMHKQTLAKQGFIHVREGQDLGVHLASENRTTMDVVSLCPRLIFPHLENANLLGYEKTFSYKRTGDVLLVFTEDKNWAENGKIGLPITVEYISSTGISP